MKNLKIKLTRDNFNFRFKQYEGTYFFGDVNEENLVVNYSVAYGVSCAALEIDKEEALETFLYNNTSGLITNAVKSVPLSQSDGQKMLTDLYPLFHELVEEVKGMDETHLGISMPGFEVRSMQHEVLYTRLYMS